MLYDSTKSLLQGILRALETDDEDRWDDQTESGKACLYEMHQMSGALYTPFRSDRQNANSRAQDSHPEKLTRAIPHVRTMLIAIRHKDQIHALESARLALAEMNGPRPSVILSGRTEPPAQAGKAAVPVRVEKPARRRRLLVEDRQVLASTRA